ncbi:MarR family winged helix-turn-helix transcriptional regulator [Culicoidibacter larvae]|uniref:MarR family transcriptional regulator n=1 Tax=Culicoidibacter larvae TaxID=2579976 RepID=A0A5R8QH18_9FIRM|nr:MarR family transcriptional regulator [Culicoidibacter larvae]TLG77064.1 MarR family transcriptional regulator [Culicoidibacter larvae]
MEFKKSELNDWAIDLANKYISAGHQILDVKREFLAKHGVTDLTLHEVRAIRYISQMKKVSLGTLANKMNITISSLTPIVQRLEKKGYVQREKDKDDRRISYISLTEHGEEVTKISMMHITTLIARIAKKVTETEYAGFLHVLDLIESTSAEIAAEEDLTKGGDVIE